MDIIIMTHPDRHHGLWDEGLEFPHAFRCLCGRMAILYSRWQDRHAPLQCRRPLPDKVEMDA